MLNVSSPALYDDDRSSNNVTMDNKRNTSMMGTVDPSARPTLCGDGQNLSSGNENISSEETINKTTYEFKIILLGSIAVGKTSILNRYITNDFNDTYASTLKIDFKTKIMNINDNVRAKLHIWDTCGDEKFRAITRSYYKDAQGILLIYDITKRESFDSIINWQNEIRNNAPKNSVLFLVGNKTDLNKERQIPTQEGKIKAEDNGMLFTEVSAKNGDNIHIIFEKISEAIMASLESMGELKANKESNKILANFKDIDIEENKKRKCLC